MNDQTINIAELEQKATTGDAEAQFELACCYAEGKEIETDNELAYQWCLKSAEQQHADACLFLGMAWLFSILRLGACPSLVDEIKFCRKSIQRNAGNLSLLLALARHYSINLSLLLALARHDSIAQCHEMLGKAAESGNVMAQYWWGQTLYEGIITGKPDFRMADSWFTRAANADLYEAQCWLARMGIEWKNEAQAVRWWEKAWKNKVTALQNNQDPLVLKENDEYRALIHQNLGTEFLPDMATALFHRLQYFAAVATQIDKEENITLMCLHELAESGIEGAAFRLAEAYANGIYVKQDDELALKWYMKAAAEGCADAYYPAASRHLKNKHLPAKYNSPYPDDTDDCLAVQYLYRAAINQNPDAIQWIKQTYLAFTFPYIFNQKNADEMYQFAFKWLLDAYEKYPDDYRVAFGLGVLYFCGKGTAINEGLAGGCFVTSQSYLPVNDNIDNSMVHVLYNFSALYCDMSSIFIDRNFLVTTWYLAGFFAAVKNDSSSEISCNVINMIPTVEIEYYLARGEFERAELLCSNMKIAILEDNAVDYSLRAMSLSAIRKAKELKEVHRKLQEKEKEMLSFFTHTMRNALATAPASLREAINLLGSDIYEKDANHYNAINKIASLFSSLSLTDCLIDTFKQSISDPNEFRQAWDNDHSGDATPRWVIASALRQSLNRIYFLNDPTDLEKLIGAEGSPAIKQARKSFIDEVLPLNLDNDGIEAFYGWVSRQVPSLEIFIQAADDLHFGANKTRFSLLFAMTSELILNALKYWDGQNRISIQWQQVDTGDYQFAVSNHCQPNASSNLAGTHKGLAFIKRLMELLENQARFDSDIDDGLFTAILTLNHDLLRKNE